MNIRTDPASPVPVYEQIRSQLSMMISSGVLPPGTQLPTIRQLAGDLGIAKATVNKAYELLLRESLLVSAGRKGTVVAERIGKLNHREVLLQLDDAAERYVSAARLLGVSNDEAIERIHNALRRS